MKIYQYYLYLAAFMLISVSCNKELNTLPTDKISDEEALSSVTNLQAALNGIYRTMYQQQNGNQSRDGQGSVMIIMDYMGEDIVHTGSGTTYFRSDYRWQIHRTVEGSTNEFIYGYYYKIIKNANNIILAADSVAGDENVKNGIKGEALAFRGWAYFQLVQIFGKRYSSIAVPNTQLGVPLVLTPTTTGQPRATVEEVYAQINKDLDDAIANLSPAPGRLNKTHINVNVARGFKARVAMAMENYELAAQTAKEALDGFITESGSEDALMNNAQYLDGFTSINNPEWMWGSTQLADQLPAYGSFYAYMSANYFSSSHTKTNPKAINKVLYNTLTATDIRRKLWDPTGEDRSFPLVNGGERHPYMHRKFLVKDINISAGDIPYMRSAEMYLIQAEAYARLGLYQDAIDALYPLAVNRDPSYTKPATVNAAVLNTVMNQRRVELWGEGFRFLDLKRTDTGLARSGTGATPALASTMTVNAGDVKWTFLIPQSEIDSNPAIQANN